MSADNGTYILQTYGPEYRVAHVQGIDSIYESWNPQDNTWNPSSKWVEEYFNQSKVYTSLEEAWDVATDIDNSIAYSEYGACLIKDFAEISYEALSKPQQEIISDDKIEKV